MVATERGPTVADGSWRARVRPVHVVVMVVALVPVAVGWVLAQRSDESDVEALVVEYLEAWDAGDGDAVVALMTDDGVHTCPLGTFAVDDDGGAALVAAVESMSGDDFVVVDGPIATRSNPPLEAVTWVRIEAPAGDVVGLATYDIVEEDGTLLIARSLFEHR